MGKLHVKKGGNHMINKFRTHHNKKRKNFNIVITLILLAITVMMIFPYIYMISSSLKRELDIFNYPFEWIPSNIVNNYRKVLFDSDANFPLYYLNSMKITVISIVGLCITSSFAAYGFTKIRFKGRNAIFLCYLATLMIPNQVILVPRFILFNYIGINDTHLALILPAIFNAFGVFLMRQFMVSIPYELNEAAKIDGAGELRTWFQVIVPLTKPIMVTLAVVSIVWTWNDYQNALIFLKTTSLYTIPLGLQHFMEENGTFYSLIMTASVLATLPPLFLFFGLQKHVVAGLTAGAVKG